MSDCDRSHRFSIKINFKGHFYLFQELADNILYDTRNRLIKCVHHNLMELLEYPDNFLEASVVGKTEMLVNKIRSSECSCQSQIREKYISCVQTVDKGQRASCLIKLRDSKVNLKLRINFEVQQTN